MGIIPKIRQKRKKETKMSSEKFGADGVTLGDSILHPRQTFHLTFSFNFLTKCFSKSILLNTENPIGMVTDLDR